MVRTQPELPLSSGESERCRIAHGVCVDFGDGTAENPGGIRPARPASLVPLLASIDRMGAGRPLPHHLRCTVLAHSVCVAETAAVLVHRSGRFVTCAERDVWIGVARLYGMLHDCGEILGGDVPAVVPRSLVLSLKQGQARFAARACWEMGLPQPDEATRRVVKLADLAVIPSEVELSGVSTGFGLRPGEPIGGPLDVDIDSAVDLARGVLDGLRSGAVGFPLYRRLQATFLAAFSVPRLVLVSDLVPGFGAVLVDAFLADDPSSEAQAGFVDRVLRAEVRGVRLLHVFGRGGVVKVLASRGGSRFQIVDPERVSPDALCLDLAMAGAHPIDHPISHAGPIPAAPPFGP